MNDTIQLFNFELNFNPPSIILESNLYFIIAILAVIISAYLIKRLLLSKRNQANLEPVELTLGFGDSSIKYNIQRNYENLEIAHSIYIELITRKAAMPFDEENDVIKEIYDSWYSLFKITRDEIKKLSGDCLQNVISGLKFPTFSGLNFPTPL